MPPCRSRRVDGVAMGGGWRRPRPPGFAESSAGWGPLGCGQLFARLHNRLNKLLFLAFAKKLKIPYRGLNLSARGHDQDMSADGWPRTQIGARPPHTPTRRS